MSNVLHDRALVIDGLSYHSDGYTGDLRQGGVDALNVTVCHFEADFTDFFARKTDFFSFSGHFEQKVRHTGKTFF